MRGWSFPAGRLFGVDIRIHVTFLFLLGFVWFSESLNMGVSGPGRGLALVAIIFGCVVAHELAHAVVARRSGVAVRSIILLPIGGVTLMDDPGASRPDPARDIRISVAGPLLNLIIAAIAGADAEARDLAELNAQLLAACREDEQRQIAGHTEPVGAAMIEERAPVATGRAGLRAGGAVFPAGGWVGRCASTDQFVLGSGQARADGRGAALPELCGNPR